MVIFITQLDYTMTGETIFSFHQAFWLLMLTQSVTRLISKLTNCVLTPEVKYSFSTIKQFYSSIKRPCSLVNFLFTTFAKLTPQVFILSIAKNNILDSVLENDAAELEGNDKKLAAEEKKIMSTVQQKEKTITNLQVDTLNLLIGCTRIVCSVRHDML